VYQLSTLLGKTTLHKNELLMDANADPLPLRSTERPSLILQLPASDVMGATIHALMAKKPESITMTRPATEPAAASQPTFQQSCWISE
jgi:hypothetical protein